MFVLSPGDHLGVTWWVNQLGVKYIQFLYSVLFSTKSVLYPTNINFVRCRSNVFKASPTQQFNLTLFITTDQRAGALVQWLKLPVWKSEIAGSNPTLALKFQRNKLFLPRSHVKILYCGEPLWPRSGVLGLRPPGLEFRILCLEGSVTSFISPSSGCSPGPV